MPKSRLTASRKTRRRASVPNRGQRVVECLDELADCHHRLAILAGLLESCNERELLEPSLAKGAGELLAEQVRRLDELVHTLAEETTKP